MDGHVVRNGEIVDEPSSDLRAGRTD